MHQTPLVSDDDGQEVGCKVAYSPFKPPSLLLRTSHNECGYNVSASGHGGFDESSEASAVPHFNVHFREVVEEIHDCVDVTWS